MKDNIKNNLKVLEWRGHCADSDVDGRIILRWILRKLEGGLDGVGSG
jgi:hypothetical protein